LADSNRFESFLMLATYYTTLTKTQLQSCADFGMPRPQ
jgi:hypothetical protein